VNATQLLFDTEDVVLARPRESVPAVVVTASEEDLTAVAGVALWGPLLDRLNVAGEADRRRLRPIGPGGYTGGECYRALVETQLAGGDFLSDRALLADDATAALRGTAALPSTATLSRFLGAATLGWTAKAAAVNRRMLARAWAAGAAPTGPIITIDPDATRVATYGAGKHGSAFARDGQTGLSPLVGICGETGDVLAVRARGGAANDGRAMGRFIGECVAAIPVAFRRGKRLWIRVDSAGYQHDVVAAADRHDAYFTVTARQLPNVVTAIHELATSPHTQWRPAADAEADVGSEIAETGFEFAGQVVRLIVRRQPRGRGAQLAFDDVDGWRFHALISNVPKTLMSAVSVELAHRLRGGAPEEAIRQLKGDFGMNHAPVTGFFGNWLWWQAAALAYNAARWLRVLALPRSWHGCRGKRLRLGLLNVPARVVRTARRLHLRLPAAYQHAAVFIAALERIRALPAFA
jgi:Transposase DDE domain group 1